MCQRISPSLSVAGQAFNLQMPGGVPLAIMALNGVKTREFWPRRSFQFPNRRSEKMIQYKKSLLDTVEEKSKNFHK